MAEKEHLRMVRSGLLGSRAAARDQWPAWARAHLAGCERCQAEVRSVDLLVAAGREIVAELPPGPAPDIATLRRRLLGRPPPPVSVVARALAPFPPLVYRNLPGSPAGALDLARMPDGIRAWDPDATHLAMFAVTEAGGARLVRMIAGESPPVGIHAPLAPDVDTRVIAVGSHGPLDLPVWLLWLDDMVRSGSGPIARVGADDRIHLAELFVRAPAPGLLRVQPGTLPPARPAAQALLADAGAAQAGGRLVEAAALYRRVLEGAQEDMAARVAASTGLAEVLDRLGYVEDADTVYAELEAFAMDRAAGARVACARACHALVRGDITDAHAWREELARLDPDAAELLDLDRRVAIHEERWAAVLDATETLAPKGSSPADARIRALQRATALARTGDDARAAELLATLAGDEPSLLARLWRIDADAHVQPGATRRGRVGWRDVAARVADACESAMPTRSEGALLVRLARDALFDGERDAARRLLRLRFLRPAEEARGVPLVALVDARTTLLELLDGGARPPGGEVGVFPLSRPTVRALVLRAREDMVAERWASDAIATLRGLLLPRVGTDRGEADVLWMASDGTLADLPMAALAAVDGVLPACAELVPRPAPFAPCTSTLVASLADPGGDLPGAAAEVAPGEADLRLRGAACTRGALRDLGTFGLVHIAMHTRREAGVPLLAFADGLVAPSDVEQLSLPAAPVVLLSGCGTATRSLDRGVDRSFANAFLRAGASAVIATQWAVDDRLMGLLVRKLLAAWPFADPERVVSRVCTQLRAAGSPTRLWAAPVVYAPR